MSQEIIVFKLSHLNVHEHSFIVWVFNCRVQKIRMHLTVLTGAMSLLDFFFLINWTAIGFFMHFSCILAIFSALILDSIKFK